MVLTCIKVKRFEESMFPARGYCNRRLQRYRPTQFSGVEIGSENWKFGICALSCTPARIGLLLYCGRFVTYPVRNCESTLMQLWTFLLFHRSACLSMHPTTMKAKVIQLQRACKNKVVVE